MAFLVLWVASFVVAFVLRWLRRSRTVAVAVPVVGLILLILFDAYVLPYRGGGASMWPIAVILGAPVALLGGLCGAYASGVLKRWQAERQGGT
jgi:hypothetical protein